MEIIVNKLPEHDYKCIIVPSEKMSNPVSDYKMIISEGKKYKIIQWVTIHKAEPIPTSLLLLAIGIDLEKKDIYKKYRKSDRLIFFICNEIKNE